MFESKNDEADIIFERVQKATRNLAARNKQHDTNVSMHATDDVASVYRPLSDYRRYKYRKSVTYS